MHLNKKIILKLDIENFFDNISFMNIYNKVFSLKYFPKNIGILLTYLCTYNDYLPQGAPTSPYISNLILYEFDEEIGKWCNNLNIAYSRYSDDLTFSGDFKPNMVITKVQKLLNRLELKLNENKTVVISNNKRQLVTGIVVNKKCQIASEYRKKIRQEIYYIKKYGIDNHLNRINIRSKKKYLLSLLGRINYVYSITKQNEYKDYLNYIKNLK